MKLEKLALIAEIVGGIAIVGSLIFVGAQINQNTAVAKANTYNDLIEQIADWRSQVVEDPELAQVWILYNRGKANELAEEDQARMQMYEASYFGIVESGFFARSRGLMDDSEWQRLSFGACVHLQRFRTNYGVSELPTFMTDEYVEYLDKNC